LLLILLGPRIGELLLFHIILVQNRFLQSEIRGEPSYN
jgi:hypothetical protein